MYDLPPVRAQTDALWTLLSAHLRREGVEGVPRALSREKPYEALWSKPDLLISQSCGYPLTHVYRETLRPVARFHYAVPGCRGPDYSSAILVSDSSAAGEMGELRGTVCAVNSRNSQSGYNAIRAMVAPIAGGGRFFSDIRVTGSHFASITAVAEGEADVCAVDCVTYALLDRYAPDSIAGVRVLGFTPACPGLPLVARTDLDADQFDRLRAALRAAISDPEGERVRQALFIDGLTETVFDDYLPVLEMEASANRLGYPELR